MVELTVRCAECRKGKVAFRRAIWAPRHSVYHGVSNGNESRNKYDRQKMSTNWM